MTISGILERTEELARSSASLLSQQAREVGRLYHDFQSIKESLYSGIQSGDPVLLGFIDKAKRYASATLTSIQRYRQRHPDQLRKSINPTDPDYAVLEETCNKVLESLKELEAHKAQNPL